jgi:hypothetical protein
MFDIFTQYKYLFRYFFLPHNGWRDYNYYLLLYKYLKCPLFASCLLVCACLILPNFAQVYSMVGLWAAE